MINTTFILLLLSLVFIRVESEDKTVSQLPGMGELYTMQFYNDQVFIGGKNRLFRLAGNLSKDSLKSVDTKCTDCTTSNTENINKVLLVNIDKNQLIVCGTGYNGRCEIRNINNISEIKHFSSPNVSVPGRKDEVAVSTDVNKPAVGLVTKDGHFMLAVTYGSEIYKTQDLDGAWSYNYPISTRHSTGDSVFSIVVNENILPKKLKFRANTGKIEDYLIYYKTAIQHRQFSYFLTNQKSFVGTDYTKYVSKLVRICQDDVEYRSYVDIPLQCKSDGESYDLVQDAVIMDLDNGSSVFIGVFSEGSKPENPHGKSVICSTLMSSLNTTLGEVAPREFIVCKNKSFQMDKSSYYLETIRGSIHGNCLGNVSYAEFDYDYECAMKDSQYYFIVGHTPVDLTPSGFTTADEGYITTLHAATIERNPILLAGTSKGHILKFVMLKDGNLHKYSKNDQHKGGTEIKAIYQRTGDDFDYYVMNKNMVVRYASSDCSEFDSCEATMEGRNPNCGWCVYEDRATQSKDCCKDCSNKTNHWLSALESCVSIDVEPKGFDIENYNEDTVKVNLTVTNLPSDELGSYYCLVNGEGVVATKQGTDNIFECVLPKQDVHTEVNIALMVETNGKPVTLAETPFLFFNCSHFNMCGKCVNTVGADCHWCSDTASCLRKTSDSCPAEPVKLKGLCPMLRQHNFFEHSKSPGHLLFNITNLNVTGFVFNYAVGTDQTQLCNVEGDAVKCSIFKTVSDDTVRKEVYGVKLFYKPENIPNSAWAEIDDDDMDGSKVTIYNCSVLGRICSYCKALRSDYNCSWCDGQCSFPKSECSVKECPAPDIKTIIPNDGPVKGRVTVIIGGDNFGYGTVKPTQAHVGGILCYADENSKSIEAEIPTDDKDDYDKEIYDRFSCKTSVGTPENIDNAAGVNLTRRENISGTNKTVKFTWKNVSIESIFPTSGPAFGGSTVTIKGKNLGVGERKIVSVKIGVIMCDKPLVKPDIGEGAVIDQELWIECIITNGTENTTLNGVTILMAMSHYINSDLTYRYLADPVIDVGSITPKKGFLSGGTNITVEGKNLANANSRSLVLRYDEEEEVKEECKIETENKLICKVPKAPRKLEEDLNSKSTGRRKKRDECQSCIKVEILVKLDGLETKFTITYYHDPTINKFGSSKKLYSSDEQELTITGNNLNLVVDRYGVDVSIGVGTCQVIELTMTELKCVPPPEEPRPSRAGSSHPEVNVTMGNINQNVGYLQYEKEVEKILIIAGSVGGSVLAIIIIVLVIICYKYRKVGSKAKKYQESLSTMEMEIKRVAREEFLDMHTTMSTVNKSLVEQGFPYHNYQQYAGNVMFATDYLLSEPVVSSNKMSDDIRSRSRKGMEKLEGLLVNKFFLVSLILTMDKQRRFFMREKSNFAGNLCAILMGRMDYLNEILSVLLTNLVQESTGKKGMKTLFRRCESITEKLLSNWLSLCLYPHLKSHTGSPLYLMYIATQKTMQSGPVDAVTGDAKYTLSEEKLLKKFHGSTKDDGCKDLKFEAKTLTLNMVVDNGEEMYECKVLDCDTITQVKAKCLEQIYVNYPASQLCVDPAELVLEWHSGFSGRMTLQDEDNTSTREGEWVRLNTLAHYLVTDNSNMALVDPKVNEAQEDYVNLAAVNLEQSMGCNGSIDSESPLTGHDQDPEDPIEIQRWHLVKKEEENSKPEKSAIDELYLNRLFTTKQSLMDYMKPLFNLVLDKDCCPPPVKFLYDFLDDLGDRYRVDPEIVHAWKSHSYTIRVWASLMKTPALLFDVNAPSYVSDNLDIISQVFIESFSMASQKFTKDSPSQKLIFHNEMNNYRERVKEFYKNVKVTSASPEEHQVYMAEVNRLQQTTSFNKTGALYRFYQQIKPYSEDILDDLAMGKETSGLHLNKKLEEIFEIMEEEA